MDSQLKMIVLLLTSVICTLLLPTVSGYTFEEPPSRQIQCAMSDKVCDITLRVTYTTTLTANRFNSAGGIDDTGDPVSVNSTGGYELDYESSSPSLRRILPIPGDGITKRPIYAINHLFPGPTIVGHTNQTVRIRVINHLPVEAITLHWHGMHQIGTPHMDGAAFITQCPILPNTEFTYQFQLYPEGTFWYHAHIGAERSNGLFGALIVRPMKPDSELVGVIDNLGKHTMLLTEWLTVNSQEKRYSPFSLPDPKNPKAPYTANSIPNHGGTTVNIFLPAGLLINNAGWMYTDDENCERLANTTLPIFGVGQGNRYLFRVIGSQSIQPLRISVQNHRLQLLATDGVKTNISSDMPQEVDYIIVNVSERYDFILHANQAIDNYAIVVETLEVPSILEKRGYCVKAHRGYAVLQYEGASTDLPKDFDSYDPYARCTANQTCYAVNCPFQNYPPSVNTNCINLNNLQLVYPEQVPNQEISETVFLNFHPSSGFLNSHNFLHPSSPLLSQIDDIDSELFCEYTQERPTVGSPLNCIHTYTTTTETIDIVLSNLGKGGLNQHPVHIHGHYFHILHVGYPTYNEDGTILERNKDINCTTGDGQCNHGVLWANGTPPISACLLSDSCLMKDTATVPAGGYVWVRLACNNPGWWLLHCHNERHLKLGMAIVINATSARGSVDIPPDFPHCGSFSQETGNKNTELALNKFTESASNEITERAPNESTGPSQSECTNDIYRGATIALAIVSCGLLIALIVVSILLIMKSADKQEKYQRLMPSNLNFK